MESILTSLKCEIYDRNERMKVAMRLDDNRIHFPIHQRDAARISIEMTELTTMKGNLLLIVTNVNLSRVTLSVTPHSCIVTATQHTIRHNNYSPMISGKYCQSFSRIENELVGL